MPSEHHTTLQLQCPGEAEKYYFSIVQLTEGTNLLCKVTQKNYAEELATSSFNHFSGTLPISWKALENTECFSTCACRAPSPVKLRPRQDLCTLLRRKQRRQFCTGQATHFSGKMQVTAACAESCLPVCKLAVPHCNSVTRCSDVFKSMPCGTPEEQANMNLF